MLGDLRNYYFLVNNLAKTMATIRTKLRLRH